MIELKNVSKKFYQKNREITALADISLRVTEGKIFGVIGASGAGKSTLIRCINLLEVPTAGEVFVDGKNLTKLSAKQLAKERRHIGMIFQHFNLLSSRTVFENISFPLELDGMPKDTIRQRVTELLQLVNLQDKIYDYPANLSGGQKQRVAIARTLASNPKVLLCDEATSALDPATTRSILNLLKDVNRRFNITILLITHEMDIIKTICDRVAVISSGQMVEQGTVSQIFTSPQTELAKEFIRSSLHIEVPDVYRQKLQKDYKTGLIPLLRLELTERSVNEPVLSEAARLFDINVNIISAQMDYAGDTNFGVILVTLSGNADNYQRVMDYFSSKDIKIKVEGYV